MSKKTKGARIKAYKELMSSESELDVYEKCCLTIAFLGYSKGEALRHILMEDIEAMDKKIEEKTQSFFDKKNNKEV